jgi:hypothetical protein
MTFIIVEQSLYGAFDGGGYRFVARSPGFREEWISEAERICAGFGERPAGVACAAAVFAQPLGRHHVAIVQAADQGIDDAGRPGALGFHLLVLSREHYRAYGGDPFQLAEWQSPPWHVRGELPALSWPAEPLPPRTVDQTRRVLKRPDGPNLLGGSQVLVDGGRVVFQRQQPDSALLRDLWQLLPTRTRTELWPATFAFGNALRFHVLAVPKAEGDEFKHYHTEEQAGDYPEGRYELALQIAVEAGDQRELDRLFRRRSQADTIRLGITILVASLVVLLLVGLFNPQPPAPKNEITKPASKHKSAAQAVPDLPPADQYPSLTVDERNRLTRQLMDLVIRSGEPFPLNLNRSLVSGCVATGPTMPQMVTVAFLSDSASQSLLGAEWLMLKLDNRLGAFDERRAAQDLGDQSPIQRQLRVLLWKHGVASYNDPRLNVFELLERLEPLIPNKQ